MNELRGIGSDQSGYTLVEVLSAMAVFGVVLATFATIMGSAIRHSGEIERQSNLQVEARTAITTVSQDLRQAYDGDDNVLTAPIEAISSTQMTFLSPDRSVPFRMRRVVYRLNAGRIERAFSTSTDTDGYPWSGLAAAPSNWQTVTRDVVNNGTTAERFFVYKDADGNETTNRALIQTVDITLIVASLTSPSRETTYKSSATVRGES